jgi:hypothetical protein
VVKFTAGDQLRRLPGVADRCRECDKARGDIGVASTDAVEAAEEVGHVGSEKAGVDVHLIEHHQAQSLEETGPAGMCREQGGVEHLGVGDENTGSVTGPLAAAGAGVGVEGHCPERLAACGGKGVDTAVPGGYLIVCQRLGGKQQQGGGGGIVGQTLYERHLVAQALPAGGGRGHQRILTRKGRIDRFGLMTVESRDAQGLQIGARRPAQPFGQRGIHRFLLGHFVHMDDLPPVGGIGLE